MPFSLSITFRSIYIIALEPILMLATWSLLVFLRQFQLSYPLDIFFRITLFSYINRNERKVCLTR